MDISKTCFYLWGMYRLLSLFDYSGEWAAPFEERGWEVIPWDIKRSEFMDINLFKSAEQVLEMFEDVNGILAAPPCTDFAVSGSQYWKKKDESGQTQKSIQLVNQMQKLVNLFEPTDPDYDMPWFWVMENPVGRIKGLFPELGEPYYFHPYEFAGYTNPTPAVIRTLNRIREKNGHKVTDAENKLVLKYNAYTKKTGLWGNFNRELIKKPIPPVKTAPQGSPMQRLGGCTVKTKEERSYTPSGFAEAFCLANIDFTAPIEE